VKPIVRTMWMATDGDGARYLYDEKPKINKNNNFWLTAPNDVEYHLDNVKPPKRPEKSLKKVTVTIEEAK